MLIRRFDSRKARMRKSEIKSQMSALGATVFLRFTHSFASLARHLTCEFGSRKARKDRKENAAFLISDLRLLAFQLFICVNLRHLRIPLKHP